MDERARKLQALFVKNRTEELGADVWESFVVPPFYDRLDLQQARKPRVIVGGRGYGKTMLLRYLSHQSMFSPKRRDFPEDPLSHVGLYWRADTQFFTAMAERGQTATVWSSAFNHLIALDLGKEILKSLKSIAGSLARILPEESLQKVDFSPLSVYNRRFVGGLANLSRALEECGGDLEMWVSNVETGSRHAPEFLPGTRFLKALISCVREQVPALEPITYFVYVDEFESLLEYQQRIVNTFIKQSESPLIFNVAMKRFGFRTDKTVGEESIVDPDDYRKHDLDYYLQTDDFGLFAAEVLFLQIGLAEFDSVPIDVPTLRDPSRLDLRKKRDYRERVLARIRDVLPALSHEQLADSVFGNPTLERALRSRIEKALAARGSQLSADQFCRPKVAQASVVSSALLFRTNVEPESVLQEMDKLEAGCDNRFTGTTDWLHNNFIGCLLSIYKSSIKICPFYAGFDTFCLLARGNLRHFLELCHQSINQVVRKSSEGALVVPVDEQALAARYVSAKFLSEVRKFGCLGSKLHAFVLRLGSLFALVHDQPGQSEPERSHFAIVRGAETLASDDEKFLQAAQMWSVLFAEEATKAKDTALPMDFEYVLNPIYAPYFNISYRKIKRLELTSDEFRVIVNGTYDDVNSLLRKYSRKWTVNLDDADPTLFSHLLEDTRK